MSKNVILYARVSTQKQSTQGESLNVQIEDMRRYAKLKNWNVLEEFQEQFSGTKDSRPELNRAIDKIKLYKKSGIQVDYFLVTKIDRNTRGGMEVHLVIKNRLKDLGVSLRDTQGIIQDDVNIVHVNGIDTTGYSWANNNPGETTEIFYASAAKQERNSILQRTIPQEMRNSLEGYWVRPPVFGYDTEAIINENGTRKTIQVMDPIESKWIIRIFEMKSAGYSDDEIVDEINSMGYLSRVQHLWDSNKQSVIGKKGGLKLAVKQLQSYLQNPIYAGIAKITWRGNSTQFIKQKYKGLVTIDLWNRANSGKRKIINDGGTITISSGSDDPEDIQVTKRRKRLHPDFPFGKLIFADNTDRFLNYNNPKGRRKHYKYYSTRGSKNYPIEQFEQSIVEYFNEIEGETNWLNLLDMVVTGTYKLRKQEFISVSENKQTHLQSLHQKRNMIISNIDNYIGFEEVMKAKNEELSQLKSDIDSIEKEVNTYKEDIDVVSIKDFSKLITEHLGKLASGSRNYEVLKIIFNFTLGYTPQYSEILNRTAKLRPFLALSTKKRTIDDSYSCSLNELCTGWQSHLELNQDLRLWRPLH